MIEHGLADALGKNNGSRDLSAFVSSRAKQHLMSITFLYQNFISSAIRVKLVFNRTTASKLRNMNRHLTMHAQ